MKVIWTPRAAKDLDALVDYIGDDSPDAATRVASRILNQISSLASMPDMGRIGLVPGTRELVFRPWSYIAVYKVVRDEVRILRIRHASQNWP